MFLQTFTKKNIPARERGNISHLGGKEHHRLQKCQTAWGVLLVFGACIFHGKMAGNTDLPNPPCPLDSPSLMKPETPFPVWFLTPSVTALTVSPSLGLACWWRKRWRKKNAGFFCLTQKSCDQTHGKEWDFNYQPQPVIPGYLNHEEYLRTTSEVYRNPLVKMEIHHDNDPVRRYKWA